MKVASNCPASLRDGFHYVKFMYIYRSLKPILFFIQEPPRKAPYYPLGSKPFSGFGFWPTFHWPAHLLDHDYMNTWFDPRPVMEGNDISKVRVFCAMFSCILMSFCGLT